MKHDKTDWSLGFIRFDKHRFPGCKNLIDFLEEDEIRLNNATGRQRVLLQEVPNGVDGMGIINEFLFNVLRTKIKNENAEQFKE